MIEKNSQEPLNAAPAPASHLGATVSKCISGLGANLDDLKGVLQMLEAESGASQHLAAIVGSAEEAIISKNLEGIVLSWNASAARIFGYTAAEMIGHSITVLLPPGRENEESTILARIRTGEHIKHFQTIRRRKDGTYVPISLSVSPVLDAAGRIIGASKIARDITAELRSRVEQEELTAKLQLALNEIKTLRGLIAICMHCKKIRNDVGYWEQLEKYFSEHGDVKFSHGICPECLEKHYGKILSEDPNA